MTQRDQFINDLEAFLAYKQEEGFQTLEISADTLQQLQKTPAAPAPQARPTPTKPAPAPKRAEKTESTLRVAGKTLEEIAGQIRTCSTCPLHISRKNTVPGEGNSDRPDILFIGECPGTTEDAQGRPFVGEAGQLLDKMIKAMGYQREEIFITNIVKCHPPGTRVPLPEEMTACTPYLKAQIALIKPKIIVALGKTAVEGLLNERIAITRTRGIWKTYEGIDLMPTFHPAHLLRSPEKKREVWADLKAVLTKLGKEPPIK